MNGKTKRKLRFVRENLLKGKVPNRPGLYTFYDKNGKRLYVGHAKRLRHRVQSYHQKDCYDSHPTKEKLRKRIHSYEWQVMSKNKAQKKEKRQKKKTPFNIW